MDEMTRQLVLDYQEIFKTAAGKRVGADMATRFHFNERFGGVIIGERPEYTAFLLGKREAYLYILDKLNADPDAVEQTEYDNEIVNE